MTNEKAVWTNEDGGLCFRYLGGYIEQVAKDASEYLAHSKGGSIFGPYPKMREAREMLDVWAAGAR